MKTKPSKKSRKPRKEQTFEAAFKAADAEALEHLRNGGLAGARFSDADPDLFARSIDRLIKYVMPPGEPDDHPDDAVPFSKVIAQVDSAYLLGLAVGCRLTGAPIKLGGIR